MSIVNAIPQVMEAATQVLEQPQVLANALMPLNFLTTGMGIEAWIGIFLIPLLASGYGKMYYIFAGLGGLSFILSMFKPWHP